MTINGYLSHFLLFTIWTDCLAVPLLCGFPVASGLCQAPTQVRILGEPASPPQRQPHRDADSLPPAHGWGSGVRASATYTFRGQQLGIVLVGTLLGVPFGPACPGPAHLTLRAPHGAAPSPGPGPRGRSEMQRCPAAGLRRGVSWRVLPSTAKHRAWLPVVP